jgi:hypothetical protein
VRRQARAAREQRRQLKTPIRRLGLLALHKPEAAVVAAAAKEEEAPVKAKQNR